MSLFAKTAVFFGWFVKVYNSFWRAKPGISLFLTTSAVVERISNLLAFVLPLKIVLLASSEGVPRYFRGFINPDEKVAWIIGLSIAALVFYLLGLVLSILSDRLAKSGGDEVANIANDISVTKSQAEKVQSYYATCCSIVSNGIFSFLGISVLAFIKPVLLGSIILCVSLAFSFSAMALSRVSQGRVSWTAKFMRDDLGGYLNLWTYGIFIVGFLVVLVPFLTGQPASIFSAVISIILLRHSINAFSSAVKDCVKAWKWKEGIDPLVFRHVHLKKRQTLASQNLEQFLGSDNRDRIMREYIPAFLTSGASCKMIWEDPPSRSYYSYLLETEAPVLNGSRNFGLRIFPDKSQHLLKNEQYLFDHISRNILLAPVEVATFGEAGHTFQVLNLQDSHPLMGGSAWSEIEIDILEQHWGHPPTKTLLDGFTASHPLMHQRLRPELFSPARVAVTSREEEELLDAFLDLLPALKSFIGLMPLYVFNPEINKNTVREAGGASRGFTVTSWCKWSLEPVGAKLPARVIDSRLTEVLRNLRAARADIPLTFNSEAMRLVAKIADLEGFARSQKYRACLGLMSVIIAQKKIVLEASDVEFA